MDGQSEVSFSHVSVLLRECIEGLAIKPNGIDVDGTCGGAGHSSEIAKRLTTGRLIGIDQDETAVGVATESSENKADSPFWTFLCPKWAFVGCRPVLLCRIR